MRRHLAAMKVFLIAVLCGIVCIGFDVAHGRQSAIPAKRYKVDLDAPAKKRWIPVLENFDRSSLLAVLDTLETKYIKSKELMELAEIIGRNLDKYLPQPYADELRGISEYYNLDLGLTVIGNIAYDVSAWDTSGFKAMACTSIVSMDKNGGIIHGRNLDYAAAAQLRDITIEVEFHHSGKTAFIGTTYVGYVGVLTAAKPQAFSLSGDERNTGRLWENILAALEKHWPTMLMSREVVTNAESYVSAIEMLSKANTIAPMYFIIGGIKPREGAIVVRDRWGAINITRMEDTSHDWFVLETNYEPWNKPPASDDRRDTGVRAMEVFGQERMDLDNLYGVLSIPPVLNYNTTYTTVMSAADVTAYRTLIRYDRPDDNRESFS